MKELAIKNPAVQLKNLTKQYGSKKAVDSINLEVPRGVFYGLVGPNGAGKTTTLSMLSGLLKPTSGGAEVLGNDVWASHDAAMKSIGILMDDLSYPERLTARELFEYSGRLRGVTGGELSKRVNDLLEILELNEADSSLVIDFSTGMRKKAALGIALIHAPQVLILDEPFESIDPVSALAIERLLRQFVAKNGTVILSSHVMELVERLCSHVAVIVAGKIIASGSVKDVADGKSLYERFVNLIGAPEIDKQLEWLT